ncbi:MAG TPA: class I SAM-dependent methyltransferase [Polyangiaceae bacterium]|nr:class I SAM-dependent methyltransferase [Polyangiaceae bacterium]
MSTHSFGLESAVQSYLVKMASEPEILVALREETAQLPSRGMQISPEQGALMRLLVGVLGARRCLEVGTFTGYSALSVALALPDDGKVVACDVNQEWTSMAKRYFERAGLLHKFDLRIGPGVATLEELVRGGAADSFDFAFIDADKENYTRYYELCFALVRKSGLIAVDNALWDGKVADASVTDTSTRAIRELNERVRTDSRVRASLVPVGDGLLLAQKLG